MVTLIFYFPTSPPSSSRLPIGSQRRKVFVHIIQGKAGQGEGNRRIPVVVAVLLVTHRKSVPLLRSLDQAGATGSTTEQ